MGAAQLWIFDDLIGPRPEPARLVAASPPPTMEQERDAALRRHDERHALLLEHARRIAHELAARDGATCGPRVQRAMRERGYDDGSADQRYLGGCCLPSLGWERTGETVREGSRARPVPMWRRRAP